MQIRDLFHPGQEVIVEDLSGAVSKPVLAHITAASKGSVVLAGDIPLPEGAPIRVQILTSGRQYWFEARIVERKTGPVPSVVITPPRQFLADQRRRFFRVHLLFPVTLQFPGKDGQIVHSVGANGKNLSGGGVRVWCPRRRGQPAPPLYTRRLLLVELRLPAVGGYGGEALTMVVKGRIVWLIHHPLGWDMGIEFVELPRAMQERLIAWCFAFQRALLRRGFWEE